ncbi:hypothetical protein [Rhabdothermincola salaria]|uniref:hypothetical protein n=1 Tax=Rhabdothermincola salaria TaxID=2903142 RepID=UPI001E2A9FB9|nr:hypothetical protein [Rhabdothermincola salaria]MCD9625715.1 hypothetical protein [Rhabdothermincola salaria]
MGCCAGAVVLAGAPRLAIVILLIFTDRLTVAFESFWFGLIGFLLLPFTTVFFALAYSEADGGVTGIGWVFVVIGLLLDLSSYGSGGYSRQQRDRVAA